MMDAGEMSLQSAHDRKEIELLRDQIGRDRILLAGKNATLMFLDQTLDLNHPYPLKVWSQGISDFALLERDGVPPTWLEPVGKWCGRRLGRTKDGADLTCYDTFFSGYEQAKERFFQHASACGELLLPEADIPTSEFLNELFEFCRSHKLLKWDVNEQPNHPETRRHIAWLHDVYEATVRFLNEQLKSPQKKRPAHRPPDTDAEQDAGIADKWQAWRAKGNPRSVALFAKDFGYDEPDTRAALDRVRSRRKNSVKRV